MKIIVNENQRGLFFKRGRFVRLLGPGKYRAGRDGDVEIADLSAPLASKYCSLDVLLSDAAVVRSVAAVEIADEEVALHYVNGNFQDVLRRGRYAFWTVCDEHTFVTTSVATPEVAPEVPRHIFGKIPSYLYTKLEVAEYQRARLYFDNKPVRLLEAGVHYFWKCGVAVTASFVDTRLTCMEIAGQEILTRDKVAVRINFVCNYRVTDCAKALTEIDDYEEQLHVAAQLALREHVGGCTLDEILERKEQMAACVLKSLREKAAALSVEVTDAGVKDVVLPGEIREIMNTVLVAEKRAQANVVARREEVASTRSLLNTAKLMEENQTLYKLKELEYLERICEKVDAITVNGSGDLLSQLAAVLRPERKA